MGVDASRQEACASYRMMRKQQTLVLLLTEAGDVAEAT